jgi:lysozyme
VKADLSRQLRGDEGCEPCVYYDSLGWATIGVGRLVDKRKGGGLRSDEITYLLQNDIDDRITAVTKALPWFQNLDDARQGVILNMAFQLGTPGMLAFKNTLDAIHGARYDEAAAGMLDSAWAKQTPERAKRLAEQMKSGQWVFAPGA